MRFKLTFHLNNENFPIDYRKSMMSFIKKALWEYNEKVYEQYYHARDNIIKPFTFSVYLPSPKFEKNSIWIQEKKIEFNLSCAQDSLSIILYNSFNHQKNKKFPLAQNKMTLKSISLLPEKNILEKSIPIKFMSPLVVRDRQNQKDKYYSYENEKFEEMLKINVAQQLEPSNLSTKLAETLKLEAIKGKKAIIQFYEKKIETSVGIYLLTGDISLLNYLYQCGIR